MPSPARQSRFALGAGAIGSLLLHALLLVLALLFVHGTVHMTPPKPPTLVTLDLEPPPPPKPPPSKPKSPPPKPQPKPQPPRVPQPIASQTMSSVPMPTVPPPPAQTLAPAKTLTPPPTGPQPGVVGYRVSDAYKTLLEGKIQVGLRYPRMALRQGGEGTALVKVRMKRDGTIESVALVKSAGSTSLDAEAQAVFRRIGKFPPLPENFLPTASEFQFEIPITFKLVDG